MNVSVGVPDVMLLKVNRSGLHVEFLLTSLFILINLKGCNNLLCKLHLAL